MGEIQGEIGNRETAAKYADKAFELVKGSANFFAYSRLAAAYGRAGQEDKAQKMIELLKATAEKRYVRAEDFLVAYLGANDAVKAREWLIVGIDKQECTFPCLIMTAVPDHPQVDPIRHITEFRDLVQRLQAATETASASPVPD